MRVETRNTILTVVVLSCVLLIAGYVTYEFTSPRGFVARERADLRQSTDSPDALYRNLDGNTIDLTVFQGKPIVINSWASWSPYAKDELPSLALLQREFGDAVTILAVNRGDSQATVHAYLESIPNTTGLTIIQDSEDFYFKSNEGYAMPETLFYDETGNIVDRVRGTLTEDEFRTRIKSLLDTKQ